MSAVAHSPPPAATQPPHRRQGQETPAASCPSPSSGDGILAAQTNTLIGAENGSKPLPQCTADVRFGSRADGVVELIRCTIAMPSAAVASDRAADPGPCAARDRCRAPVLRRLYAALGQSCGCETLQ